MVVKKLNGRGEGAGSLCPPFPGSYSPGYSDYTSVLFQCIINWFFKVILILHQLKVFYGKFFLSIIYSKMDLFAKYLKICSRYLLLTKASSKIFDRVLNTPHMSILFILFGISLWQWHCLKAFTEDLNECQSLEMLVYSWII